jgi:hypothetical protein
MKTGIILGTLAVTVRPRVERQYEKTRYQHYECDGGKRQRNSPQCSHFRNPKTLETGAAHSPGFLGRS